MGMTTPDLIILLLWLSTVAESIEPVLNWAAGILAVLVLLIAIMCPLARDDVPPPIDNWRKKRSQGFDDNSEK